MPLRRLTLRVLVALMTSLSVLHLALEGSGVGCSSGNAEAAQDATAMSGAGSHDDAMAASMAHEHSGAAPHGTKHHAPAQERCCESTSSCGVATVASVIEHVSAPLPASRFPARSDAMLASVGTAPEPPPPKA